MNARGQVKITELKRLERAVEQGDHFFQLAGDFCQSAAGLVLDPAPPGTTGTTDSASVPPAGGALTLPTMTVPGPPTWTPTTGSSPVVEDTATGTLWTWNGTTWVGTPSSPGVGPAMTEVVQALTGAQTQTFSTYLGGSFLSVIQSTGATVAEVIQLLQTLTAAQVQTLTEGLTQTQIATLLVTTTTAQIQSLASAATIQQLVAVGLLSQAQLQALNVNQTTALGLTQAQLTSLGQYTAAQIATLLQNLTLAQMQALTTATATWTTAQLVAIQNMTGAQLVALTTNLATVATLTAAQLTTLTGYTAAAITALLANSATVVQTTLSATVVTGSICYTSGPNGYKVPLAPGPNASILTVAAGVPSWLAPTIAIGESVTGGNDWNTLAIDNNGDLTQIPPSTAGDVLTSNGASLAPTYQAPSSGGAGTWSVTTTSIVSVTATAGQSVQMNPAGAAGNITVTLPTAVGVSGQRIQVKNVSGITGNTLTVLPTGSQDIDSSNSATSPITSLAFKIYYSDGTNWWTGG